MLRVTRRRAAPEILAGLGKAEGIDLLRILWPTGVLQDEIDLPRGAVVGMKEVDRRGSSCPVLFAWNGHKYKLVTDVIGAAVVGALVYAEAEEHSAAGGVDQGGRRRLCAGETGS